MTVTREYFESAAMCLYDQCEYPAVRYCILTKLLGREAPEELYNAFLHSDIVDELNKTQDADGGWGSLESKDYTVKAKFPTTAVAINRCLYIGLKKDDRDILFMAKEYLESFLLGTSREKVRITNERIIPWRRAVVCTLLESIEKNNPLCDQVYGEWLYIAERAFEDGEYSYERERDAQHEVFGTREDRLVPMQEGLLLCRRENITPELEDAMLRHYGGHASIHGHFWEKTPGRLPESFYYEKTRRWMHTFNYINMFLRLKIVSRRRGRMAAFLPRRGRAVGLGPAGKGPVGLLRLFFDHAELQIQPQDRLHDGDIVVFGQVHRK